MVGHALPLIVSLVWMNNFKDLVVTDIVDTCGKLHIECLWFCFFKSHEKSSFALKIVEQSLCTKVQLSYTLWDSWSAVLLAQVCSYWKSRKVVPANWFCWNWTAYYYIERQNQQLYQEYFQYNCSALGIQGPNTWKDSFAMFQRLVEVAEWHFLVKHSCHIMQPL